MKTFYYTLIAMLFSYSNLLAQWTNNGVNLTTSDNVGIGIPNPAAKLHVLGKVILENNNWNHFDIKSNNPDTDAVLRLFDGLDYWAFHNDDSQNNRLDIRYNNSSMFSISNNGNIGIGTSNLSSWKLAVDGNIRAKEIKVETGWSDFVFYDDYKLPTLEEVENHIKEKGHLKDIPSAKEVEKNGIFLGEMDAKLLQKIEELTLYIIDQNKKIEKMYKEIELLKNKRP